MQIPFKIPANLWEHKPLAIVSCENDYLLNTLILL